MDKYFDILSCKSSIGPENSLLFRVKIFPVRNRFHFKYSSSISNSFYSKNSKFKMMINPSFLQIIAILTVLVITVLLISSHLGKRFDKARKYIESHAKEKENESENEKNDAMAIGLSLGMSFGLIFGIMINNIALGIALGPALGLAFGALFGEKGKREYLKK